MSKVICCPTPTYIASTVTTLNPCPQEFGQIQKLVFWRGGNSIASVTTALIATTWTTLLAATGDTKAVPSPFLNNPEMEPGAAREFGGGNETRDGIPIRLGAEATAFVGIFYEESQSVIQLMKALQCEDLEVVFINENNQFGYISNGGAFEGIPLKGLFVSDLKIGGFSEPDSNGIMFNLAPNWSKNFTISIASTFALDMVNA